MRPSAMKSASGIARRSSVALVLCALSMLCFMNASAAPTSSDVALENFWLTGGATAWGRGDGAIWRTVDDGQNWTKVLAIPNVDSRVAVAVLSTTSAAVAIGGYEKVPGGVVLYTTSSGGTSWTTSRQVSRVLAHYGVAYPASLNWVDNTNLLVLVRPNVGMNNPSGVLLLASLSGHGKTVSSTGGRSTVPSSIGQMSYSNHRDGYFLAQSTTTSSPVLYFTQSSGARWSKSTLPHQDVPLAVPQFLPREKEWILFGRAKTSQSAGSTKCSVFEKSALVSGSWRETGTCQYGYNKGGGVLLPSFEVPNHLWQLESGRLFSSSDGGKTWNSKAWVGVGENAVPTNTEVHVIEMEFITPSRGWILESLPNGSSRLLVTKDGATLWREVVPKSD